MKSTDPEIKYPCYAVYLEKYIKWEKIQTYSPNFEQALYVKRKIFGVAWLWNFPETCNIFDI
jgi:hypothetical protein